MGTKQDTETNTVVKKLAIFLFTFYLTYYLVSIALVGGLGVSWEELGSFPFRSSIHDFNPGNRDDKDALGAWLAMVITFVLSLGICFWVVASTRRSWDYLATTAVIHWIICCGVCQCFPAGWVWWITLILSVLIISVVAEFMIYQFKDLKDIALPN